MPTTYWKNQMAHEPTKLYYDHLTALISMLKSHMRIPVEHVLEIGTGWGISGSVFLEAGCKELVTVDPNMGAQYVRDSVEELKSKLGKGQNIVWVNAASEELELLPKLRGRRFDVIFVDGRHDYESVKADLQIARHFLADKGVIICDDYTHKKNGGEYGVAQAVREYMENATDCQLLEDKAGNGLAAIRHL